MLTECTKALGCYLPALPSCKFVTNFRPNANMNRTSGMTVYVVAAMKPVQSRATPGVFKTKKDSATVST